jgi:hypothetical protein
MLIRPDDGVSRKLMHRSMVDLPEPEPPMIATTSPSQARSETRMRILITNDDGINAPGLEVLTEIATEIAGPEGEVWTVAPAFEQSGVGHCISYTHPMMIAELGPRRFAAEGSPADCVLAAIYDVLTGPNPTWCCRA